MVSDRKVELINMYQSTLSGDALKTFQGLSPEQQLEKLKQIKIFSPEIMATLYQQEPESANNDLIFKSAQAPKEEYPGSTLEHVKVPWNDGEDTQGSAKVMADAAENKASDPKPEATKETPTLAPATKETGAEKPNSDVTPSKEAAAKKIIGLVQNHKADNSSGDKNVKSESPAPAQVAPKTHNHKKVVTHTKADSSTPEAPADDNAPAPKKEAKPKSAEPKTATPASNGKWQAMTPAEIKKLNLKSHKYDKFLKDAKTGEIQAAYTNDKGSRVFEIFDKNIKKQKAIVFNKDKTVATYTGDNGIGGWGKKVAKAPDGKIKTYTRKNSPTWVEDKSATTAQAHPKALKVPGTITQPGERVYVVKEGALKGAYQKVYDDKTNGYNIVESYDKNNKPYQTDIHYKNGAVLTYYAPDKNGVFQKTHQTKATDAAKAKPAAPAPKTAQSQGRWQNMTADEIKEAKKHVDTSLSYDKFLKDPKTGETQFAYTDKNGSRVFDLFDKDSNNYKRVVYDKDGTVSTSTGDNGDGGWTQIVDKYPDGKTKTYVDKDGEWVEAKPSAQKAAASSQAGAQAKPAAPAKKPVAQKPAKSIGRWQEMTAAEKSAADFVAVNGDIGTAKFLKDPKTGETQVAYTDKDGSKTFDLYDKNHNNYKSVEYAKNGVVTTYTGDNGFTQKVVKSPDGKTKTYVNKDGGWVEVKPDAKK